MRHGEVLTTLFTVGHGTSSADELVALLRGAGVELLMDVRRFPGSRKHPEMGRDALQQWLPDAGIDYRWEEDLGGRRRLPAGQAGLDPWWTVEAFRAYAAYTRTPEFSAAFARLLAAAEERTTAVMCSESVWWRCHRRLISDVAVLAYGVDVTHLLPGGKASAHRVAEGARLEDGKLYWDATGR